MRFWQFIRKKTNREILTWLGGGLVAVAMGAWAVTVYFFPPQKVEEAKPGPNVEARCGGLAIVGNVSGTTISAGTTSNADCSGNQR